MVPTPPHAALALHTNSPSVNVASIITDCHSSSWGGGGHAAAMGVVWDGPASKPGSWDLKEPGS